MSWFLAINITTAQVNWILEEKASMPMATSNNAVTAVEVGGMRYVYSFAGIDTTLIYSGIHLKAFRYDLANDTWDTIPDVPDSIGKIAAAASTIKNRIYLVGGYYVASNGDETSSDDVHILDPQTDQWLPDGQKLPVVTDDHFQSVWRDSLLYVIGGWSDSTPGPVGGGNIINVQIYHPETDSWMQGTPMPNTNDYKTFGASGVIIDDTIYIAGGVHDNWPFEIVPNLRIGLIDPQQPDSIQWSFIQDSSANIYRSAGSAYKGMPIWFGGAGNAYNFDGIEYGTGNPVEPLKQILTYNPSNSQFSVSSSGMMPMDLRGAARIDDHSFVLAGGMMAEQEASSKTYFIWDGIVNSLNQQHDSYIFVSPNPVKEDLVLKQTGGLMNVTVKMYDVLGRLLFSGELNDNSTVISCRNYPNGLYLLLLEIGNGDKVIEKIIVQK
ncbi:MAG: T9SS type A sorting domain-containing protein [Bacteroidetes bacterium]|nr:T9SS type A sorting domain-containing protein [Bacteroidota bacterium]